MEERLTERERDILLKLTELYIREGEPVGSRTLQKTFKLPFSPATIRNVMADLEDKGYLYQPHTSAGRVPTDKGLKIYINSLFLALGEEEEILVNRLIDYLKSEKVQDRDEILLKVLDYLQSFTGYVGFGVNLVENLTVESITLVKVASEKVLIVINFKPDYVLHKVIRASIPEGELQKLSRALTQKFRGKTLREVKRELIEEIDGLRKEIAELSFKLNTQILKTLNEVNHLEIQGTANIVNMVADDIARMKKVLEILEEKSLFLEILRNFLEEKKEVSVILGSETEVEPLKPFSLVISKFRIGFKNSGVVGIIGPKRMDYTSVIPLVENVARALSKLLEEKK
ncbi:heat-inducible transcription repressor HrcA [Thermovibrio ammonificans HB-1]|uniref:Heat-inducible transcription repressor HrcA n=1 Tax=Thermovibrio ammonificans (strain DSM 15698 / JCM 12110 / HB-1) TaxID=648996 RepID=E8T4U2_THEA1|nr:heat-inducible transcriptional repressor HrcA [Thermovibrio ammonificans]ADU96354.1 heat-inducible transcription repressor HrcA [Thermovibrio ammonificans HB-1]